MVSYKYQNLSTDNARRAQCYLKDTAERLEADIARAAREGWRFAAKTVRGAYLVFERARGGARRRQPRAGHSGGHARQLR